MAAISQGKDFNFWAEKTVTSAVYTADADCIFNFRGQRGFSLFIQGGGTVEYSFNGNVAHGKLVLGSSRAFVQFENRRVSKVWFRVVAGGAATIWVEAWGQS